jgi:hypothetical protein
MRLLDRDISSRGGNPERNRAWGGGGEGRGHSEDMSEEWIHQHKIAGPLGWGVVLWAETPFTKKKKSYSRQCQTHYVAVDDEVCLNYWGPYLPVDCYYFRFFWALWAMSWTIGILGFDSL